MVCWSLLLLLLTATLATSSEQTFESATPKGCVKVLDKWCSSEIVRLSCFHTHSSGACANSRVYASLSNAGWICKALDESCSCPDSRDQLNRLFHLCANNLTAVDVFVSGESNINTYRIPAIVQTNKETLLAFAEGRVYDSSDCHRKLIVMKRSTDLGNTWEKLQIIPINLSDEHLVTANPQPVFDHMTNTTLLQFVTNDNTTHQCNPGNNNGQIISSDDGLTWSQLKSMDNVLGINRGLLPGPGGAIQLTHTTYAGRLVFCGHYGAYVRDLVWYSDDHGKTFQLSKTQLPEMDEPQVVELTNGSLLLNMRNRHKNDCQCRAISRSDDGGMTWGPIHYDPVLISPICQASLVRINDAFYFSNPASKIARENLTIRKSTNNCNNWQSELKIVDGPVAGGYSNIVPLTDSTKGGILYERFDVVNGTKRSVISFTQFPLDF